MSAIRADLSDQAQPADAGSEATVLVRAVGLEKAFGPTQALRNGSFELCAGEVHALVGENGSGKSTLVKILGGVHSPDGGSMEFLHNEIPAPRTPREAQDYGIVTVFQEVLVAEARSVLENVWMGTDDFLRARVSGKEKRTRASESLHELLGRPLPLETPAEELTLSERQACCIVRALLRRPRVLILDEATSALDIATRDRLFEIVARLCSEGAGIIFITHRLDEISAIGDRITVLRSGATVATLERGKWTSQELVRLMTGADHLTAQVREGDGSRAGTSGAPVVTVKGLQLRATSRPIDVEIRAGELVGVAGLEGHGQEPFLDALRGAGALVGKVVRHEGDRSTEVRSTAHGSRLGIAYVPRERQQATFSWMTIRENFGMPTLKRDSAFGWLQLQATRKRLTQYIGQLRIVLGRQDDRITTLSGGNQQKVVIARWLASEPRLLLLNDPTRGIDIGAKRDLYSLLVQLADDGMAIVMLSTELDEHVELMDRVLVFRENELFREIPRTGLSRRAVVSAFFGENDDQEDSS